MGEYKKYRKHSKVHTLPEGVRNEVDSMLMDTSVIYEDICRWLKKQGYDISKSTIGRYALETKKLANKLLETREQVRELVRLAMDSDDENLTEGAIQIASHKLTEKIAFMEEEIDDMDAVDAIRLMTDISRTKAYKDKVYAALKSNYEKAYSEFVKQLEKELEKHPDIIKRLTEIAAETLGKVAS